jgi:hypothetical protein
MSELTMTQIKHRFTGEVLHEGPGTLQEELQKAIASGANLILANLIGADLRGSDLSGSNLRWANLSGADLSDANLSGANLILANLSDANLSGSDLSGSNLRWANLSGSNLRGADLSRANLSWADLSGADLKCLPVGDPRGYRPVATWCEGWFIFAGCRRFTIAEARAHWGVNYKGVRSTGDQYLAAMDWLENQPKPEYVK